MKNISKLLIILITIIFAVTGCVLTTTQTPGTGEQGEDIISAEEGLELIEGEGVILVDAQNSSAYGEGHIEGAVNISRNDITTLGPYPNMLAPADKIEKALGENGIAPDSEVVIYDDNNNMDAARLWWTMKVFGHEDVKVVSGGLQALLNTGASETTREPDITGVEYEAKDKNTDMIATLEEVRAQVDNPEDEVVLLDVRTEQEYNNGTIPGSVHIDYLENNYSDGTYRPIKNIHIIYREADIEPEDTVIMYCKTSIRAAQTYLVLHNAGYRNLKLYDGAWVEWSADSSLPVQMPEGVEVEVNFQDAS